MNMLQHAVIAVTLGSVVLLAVRITAGVDAPGIAGFAVAFAALGMAWNSASSGSE